MPNKKSSAVEWVGKQYEPATPLKRSHLCYCYKKCYFGALTLEIGDYVLVANSDSDENDIAEIIDMFEDTDPDLIDKFRAIVQWYSRPEKIPIYLLRDENYVFDLNLEIVEDSRFEPNISIETISGKCRVEKCMTNLLPAKVVVNIPGKLQKFVTRYKLVPSRTSKRFVLQSYFEAPTTPQKRRKCMVEFDHKSNLKSISKAMESELRKTPKLKICREKSLSTPKEIAQNGDWVVKVVDIQENTSYKKNITDLLNDFSDIELSDEELQVSPTKKPKTNRTSNAKRNLNESLNCTSNATADSTNVLNYSIVAGDVNGNNSNINIKLRLSEHQKSSCLKSSPEGMENFTPYPKTSPKRPRRASMAAIVKIHETNTTPSKRKSILKEATGRAETPKRNIHLSNVVHEYEDTPKSIRKRAQPDDDPDFNPEIQITPRKSTRKSMKPDELKYETTTPRRRSILKTPSTKNDNFGTPKRNIKISEVVEEFEGKLNLKTPKRDEPKTPKSSRTTTRTPKSASRISLIRSGALQPQIHSRDAPIGDNLSQFQMAREKLHVSAVPESLPCREKEFEDIYSFLEGKILDHCGGCMYVSGVPGTGKTATVTQVISTLKRAAEEDEIPNFEFVEINGMRLTEPRQAYVHIYRQLMGKTLAWEQAHSLLEKRFTTKAPRRLTTVLLVDELDILCNKRQDVIYNLLNWPTMSTAQLVVITIANTMDLPERLLMGKITSRLGLTRLTFQPYSYKQLQEIVTARLVGTKAFNSDAIQLVARKVAAVSGDARRALDICRRATEIADDRARESGKQILVNMIHVQQALGEMISSDKVQAIKSCSKMEQMFLQAVTAEVARTGIEETCFLGVYSQLESLAAFSGISVPNPGRAMAICSRLGAARLLICEHSRNDIYQKILLNISTDDVHFALQSK